MVDNLNWNGLILVFYFCYAMTLILAGRVLWRARGNSLLAISVICLTLQVGTMLYFLPEIANESSARVVEPAFTRLTFGMTIYLVISSAILLGYSALFPPEARKTYSSPSIPQAVIVAAVAVALVYLFIRLKSGSAAVVLLQGKDVLGGDAYYDLRAELTEVQVQGYNRLVAHFENIARKFLYILLLLGSYFLGKYRTKTTLFVVLGATGILLIDEIIRFQKAPIMIVLAGAVVPFLIAYLSGRKDSTMRQVLTWTGGTLIAAMIAGAITVVTMGVPPREVAWFLTERLLYVPAYTGSMYFQVYPEMNPFVEFTSFRIVSALMGVEPLTYSGLISMDVAEAITGSRYNANSSMVADAYANAGYWGIAFLTVAISVVFIFIDRFVSRMRRSQDIVPLLIFYWSCFAAFGNGAVVSIIMSNALWFVPVVYKYLFKQTPLGNTADVAASSDAATEARGLRTIWAH